MDANDVAALLERFVDGTAGPWEWDDFISVKDRNPQLEALRIRLLEIERDYPPTVAMRWCSDEGKGALRALAAEIRRSKN